MEKQSSESRTPVRRSVKKINNRMAFKRNETFRQKGGYDRVPCLSAHGGKENAEQNERLALNIFADELTAPDARMRFLHEEVRMRRR